MGIDLTPLNPNSDYPTDDAGEPISGRFGMGAWDEFYHLLFKWGLDTNFLLNYGGSDSLPDNYCKLIAAAIEINWSGMDDFEQEWLGPKIKQFRNCGGFDQC